MTHLSVVIPLYKCSAAIPELAQRLETSLPEINEDYEIIFVNDGSPENDWELVKGLAEKNQKIKGINLSRNFGQHYAITAGLDHAAGEWVVVMDGDLQDQPEEISKLYEKAQEGFDIVMGRRANRKDIFFKRLFSKLFYSTFSYLTNTQQDASIANFGVYNRKTINAVLSMKDSIRYFPTLIQWVGFRSTAIDIEHDRRLAGKSSYSFVSLFRLAFNNIIAFSDKPLRLTIRLGFMISSLAFIAGIFYLVRYLSGAITVSGFTSLIISIWFLAGIVISILGLLGIYLGKVFDKVKERPTYIIDNKINIENE
jgi:polyisoprenyl-phosphate glycosyltransferase